MMGKLMENPSLKAKSDNCVRNDDILINNKGALMWENKRKNGGYALFECCISNMKATWEIVKEPVTWQEAIQAWIDGKNIYFITLRNERIEFKDGLEIYQDDFIKSEWYIE